ncbi:MAG: crossover junction endodeoxyribonuclease RuvC [Acidobacteriota bacterium]|nr:crossover junction endodeoxyribonuclease RuvC [Acidobacteriota bacterium]
MSDPAQIESTNEGRILGIDPGSATLGWGVIEKHGVNCRGIAYGTVKSSPRDRFSKRLAKIHEGLTEVVTKFRPHVIAIEEAFYAQNVKVAMKLGQVRGVVRLLGEQTGLQIAEYSPRLVKKTVAGYGNAEKHQVQEMVKILLNLEHIPEPHDAADALALAICHFHCDFGSAKIKKAGRTL